MAEKIDLTDIEEEELYPDGPRCPYCGQMILRIEPGEDPRMRCGCAEAMRFQSRRRNYEKTLGFLHQAFGDGCSEVNPAWKPADPETLLRLHQCVELVTIGGHDKVVIHMNDGSKTEISAGTVKRSVGFVMKVEV